MPLNKETTPNQKLLYVNVISFLEPKKNCFESSVSRFLIVNTNTQKNSDISEVMWCI